MWYKQDKLVTKKMLGRLLAMPDECSGSEDNPQQEHTTEVSSKKSRPKNGKLQPKPLGKKANHSLPLGIALLYNPEESKLDGLAR